MKDKILEIRESIKEEIKNIKNLEILNAFKVKYSGKSGLLTELMRGMRDVPKEERPVLGSLINEVREFVETKIQEIEKRLHENALNEKLSSEKIDITEPSKNSETGCFHPLQRTFNKLIDACVEMGFEVVTGPEVELDHYNFEMLNMPKDHPARDMQDTFYITDDIVLRTHTSPVQARVMEKRQPPIKIISPGRTYRVDNDATHSPVFHKIEGLVVDKNISLLDLKQMLTKLLQLLFGKDTKVRFRPSYFPFTEPSVEVDVSCPNCGGDGCYMCKKTGWMELMGAGMVNPKVLEGCGIDSKVYSGFAFGQGIDRLTMVMDKIPDMRMLFENDIRFLNQVK